MAQAEDTTVRRVGRDELGVLKPLWKSLQEHHARITPQLGPSPKREAEDSWQRRVTRYQRWITEPDTFVLVAQRTGGAIGYAFVTVRPGHASWASGDRIAELQTLAVLAEERGCGVGTALMLAVRTRLAELGIEELTVTVAATNTDAHRFYQRHGLVEGSRVFYGRLGEP